MRASETTTTGLEGIPEEKETDIRDRIAACDAEGLPAALGISTSKAIRLISRHREEEAKADERKVLRTGDARRLKRELLSIFASEASSPLARNSLLFLAPTLDSNEVMRRFGLVVQGREVNDALESSGREEALRKTLAHLSFLPVRTDTGAPASSATIQFFLARRQMIESVRQVLAEFGDVGAVMSFFGVSDNKVLAEVLRLTERAGIGKIEDAEAVVSDAEVEINDALRKGVRDRERVLAIIEEKVAEVVAGLGMNLEEEESMRRAALESPSVPFEFDRATTKRAVDAWRKRREEERATELRKIEGGLRQKVGPVSALIGKALLLDQILAVSSAAVKYSLTLPSIGAGGIGFVSARSPFLIMREGADGKAPLSLQPVSYAVGKTAVMKGQAKPRNAVILTGANSGGKTTLLNTVAAIHILTLLGLPVPAERAEVTPMPIYLFKKRTARRSGSLEHFLRSLIPILADRHRKLVLIDELEALTEPGAAGKIIASIINRAAATSSLFLLVTHLAKETLPYVKLPVRVDGIEASGLNERGELVVNRQPVFDHIGSSTPKLIIMKLAKASGNEAVRAIYNEVLISLEGEAGPPIQAPLSFPWAQEEKEGC
jgi:DNA mismatch repair protein MutS2